MTKQLLRIAVAGGLLAVTLPSSAQAVQFADALTVPTLGSPIAVLSTDLDRDGRTDLVTTGPDGTEALRGTPGGAQPFASTRFDTTNAKHVGVGDFDGDGYDDVVIAVDDVNPSNSPVIVRRNRSTPGTISFPTATEAARLGSPTGNASRLLVVDLNGDQLDDILYVDGTRIGFMRNITNGCVNHADDCKLDFAAPQIFSGGATPLDATPTDLTAIDVDGNGYVDPIVVLTAGSFSVYSNETTPGQQGIDLKDPRTFRGTPGSTRITVGDLRTKDDRPDVLTNATAGGFRLHRNTTALKRNPQYDENAESYGSERLNDVEVADVDEDGLLDLIGAHSSGGIVVRPASGNLPFNGSRTFQTAGSSRSDALAIADADGDNHLDVLVADGSGKIVIFLQSAEVVAPNSLPIFRYVEDAPGIAVAPGVELRSPDPTLQSARVEISGNRNPADELNISDASGLAAGYDPSTGILTISGKAPVATYQAVLRRVTFLTRGDAPSTARRTISMSVQTGSFSPKTAVSGIDVQAVPDAPVIGLSSPSAILATLGATTDPQVIDGGLNLSDPDSVNLVGATIAVTQGWIAGADRLHYPGNQLQATYDPQNGVLRFAHTASVTDYRELLRSIKFDTLGNDNRARVIQFTARDADGAESAPVTRTLAVAPTVDPNGPNGGAPALQGPAVVGQAVSTSNGSWSGSAPITFGYQWQRCNAGGQGCANIPGANGPAYFVLPSDAGTRLRAIVIARNPAPGEASAASNLSNVVAAVAVAGARQSGAGSGSGSDIAGLPKRFSVKARALRDGRIRLTIRAPRGGRVAVGRVRVGRTTRLGARTLRLRRGGVRTMTLRPTRAARRLVARRGKVSYRLRVTYRPTRGKAERKTLRVTVKKRSRVKKSSRSARESSSSRKSSRSTSTRSSRTR